MTDKPSSFDIPPKASHHCRHYNYVPGDGPQCALGMLTNLPKATLPCMPPPSQRGTCSGREEYTDAERAAWEAARNEGMERLAKAVQALPKAIPLRSDGLIDCPNCTGKLHYARWHRGAEIRCTTPGCCGAHFNIAAGVDWPQP